MSAPGLDLLRSLAAAVETAEGRALLRTIAGALRRADAESDDGLTEDEREVFGMLARRRQRAARRAAEGGGPARRGPR